MNKKRGFALIEAIFMIVFISVALLLVYKAFATSFQDEKKRVNYDNTDTIYKTYFLKQYFEENGLIDYLTSITLSNGYLEINCATLTSVNNEYCTFLTSSVNLNVSKIYITKLDMLGIVYSNLDATTIDYMKTLSSDDTTSYRFIVWYGNNEYASLKIGDPFYNLRVYLDGGTWDGITPQRLITGEAKIINEPTKEGYVFAGWNVIGTGSALVSSLFTMGTEDTSLVATWQEPIYNFAYTGGSQAFTVPLTGYYNIELWGAQGGSYSTSLPGGKGNYTSGIIQLTAGEVLYIYIGGVGGTVTSGTTYYASGGYNGGGIGGNHSDAYSQGGGGATDIRLVGGVWNDTASLNSRILVAAGGAGSTSSIYNISGSGGDLVGSIGSASEGTYSTSSYYANGGTQIAGGISVYSSTRNGLWAMGPQTTLSGYGGGGGAGYYGGAMGYGTGGGGGSSFISGYAGANAITSSSSTTATNNTIHYSGKYFINGYMEAGASSGNGSGKITYISSIIPTRTTANLNDVRYIKDCINGGLKLDGAIDYYDYWVELQAIYNGINVAKSKIVTGTVAAGATSYSVLTDGDITTSNYAYASSTGLQCVTVDLEQLYNLDEIAIWHYWGDNRTFYNNVTYVSSDNSTWITIIANTDAETSNGKRVNAWIN